jgi:hypothetical protein
MPDKLLFLNAPQVMLSMNFALLRLHTMLCTIAGIWGTSSFSINEVVSLVILDHLFNKKVKKRRAADTRAHRRAVAAVRRLGGNAFATQNNACITSIYQDTAPNKLLLLDVPLTVCSGLQAKLYSTQAKGTMASIVIIAMLAVAQATMLPHVAASRRSTFALSMDQPAKSLHESRSLLVCCHQRLSLEYEHLN